MRERARAVVIGGGVGGCSILYWLARLGWSDVVLLERAELTSGSTFHSAGLVGQLRSSLSLTKMMMASVELYRTLEDEVGLETGWHEVGSHLPANPLAEDLDLERRADVVGRGDVRVRDLAEARPRTQPGRRRSRVINHLGSPRC
jgi:glycine/D-amino acid oxidase-like deaminating enzyme